ncbi:MAG: TRAP transporter large permease subunit, partial [Pseudomonadota bacterium]
MLTKTLLILLALIGLAVPIAASLGWLGLILQWTDSPMPLYRAISDIAWQTSTDFLLVAIPMFVLMGEILLRAGITERMYDGIVKWLGWLPGGLMHSNIGSSALFAATSGSSVATAATIGTVAVPQIKKRGYNESLFLGTVAAGGTLGI